MKKIQTHMQKEEAPNTKLCGFYLLFLSNVLKSDIPLLKQQ